MPSERSLTAEQAAQMIYSTPAPTPDQVAKVKAKIERGVLARGPRGGSTTTTTAVADYIARYVAASASQGRSHARSLTKHEPVPGYYTDLLRDYFLAVLLQRTARKRTAAFNSIVMAIQAALVLLPVVIFAFGYRSSLRALIKPPARVAAERWLAGQFDEFEISQLTPLEHPPDSVELRFWYQQKGSKRVESIRILTLEGDQVVHATMPE